MESANYLHRGNLDYIDQLYSQYQAAPTSVDRDWQRFFEGFEFGQAQPSSQLSEGEMQVYNLIKTYRDYGHLKANLDPLGLRPRLDEPFQLKKFGLSEKDLDKTFHIGSLIGKKQAKLRDIIAHLESCYCGNLTGLLAECREEVRDWFRKEFEQSQFQLQHAEKKQIFEQLARTESLEKFIHTRYVGTKRFSIEGGDSMIPMLEALTARGRALGVEEIVIGMAHRGRINVLANFMGKGLDVIFSEFDGTAFDQLDNDGDVKYHLGFSSDKETPHGSCHISLAFNPSHLEAVNPVVAGMVRAKQRMRKDTQERKKVVPIMIHGDAAFVGQGVVAETLQMSQLEGYRVGGSLHIIVNNQVGFTTNPEDARSTRYASDAAKSIKAPALLVNGDDVEACVRAMDMAIRFRQEFGEDVVIDLICYRRFGHNEGDEPAFTQPKMYEIIKKHPTVMAQYVDKLAASKVISKAEADSFYQQKIDNLQQILDQVRKEPPPLPVTSYQGAWKGFRKGTLEDFEKIWETKVPRSKLDQVAKAITREPSEIKVHAKLKKLIEARAKQYENGQLDWAMGELLAYGSLCLEGHPVRLSGQDCKRGTFTHRQAVYFDVETNKEFSPLATLNPEQGEFCIYYSLLSEMAVLGFEYGNSTSDPSYLTVWEAQFGDFANGAQIIIDQFLSSGEEKWVRVSGLTMLLPHGYEGQGPEHSSARLERFLQLCAQANMQVANFTTPANLFHALRRQIKRDFRKPLIVMSPKSLLRHPKVVSPLEDFTDGHFLEVIPDPQMPSESKVETLLLCSGKVYFDLIQAIDDQSDLQSKKRAVFRLEQLYPFPQVQLASWLQSFKNLQKIVWVQEEPKNMGAWTFIWGQLTELLDQLGMHKIDIEYVGRTERASPATGSPKIHVKEQNELVQKALRA